MAAINDKIEIPNTDLRCIIFKRPIAQSKKQFWQVRMRTKDGKYIYKSSKTRVMSKAVNAAEKMYHDMIFAEKRGVDYDKARNKTFDYFVDERLKRLIKISLINILSTEEKSGRT